MLTKESQELFVLSQTIARARSGTEQELVEVFHVVKVGGRPAVGGRPGARGEWTVGGLVLPVPGDVRRYLPDHINAASNSLLKFRGLAEDSVWVCLGSEQDKGLNPGQTKHPLHLTSNPSSTPSSSPSPTLPVSLADSEALEQVPAHGQNQSFTTGLAMLLYNVCYLAHSQGVEIPLSQAGDALSNFMGGILQRRAWAVLQATAASPMKRDPDALPPRNALERVMNWIYRAVISIGGRNMLFALKAATLTVILAIPSFLKTSAEFAYANKFVWAVFMAQLTLTRFRGDTTFGVIARITSTFAGGLIGTSHIVYFRREWPRQTLWTGSRVCGLLPVIFLCSVVLAYRAHDESDYMGHNGIGVVGYSYDEHSSDCLFLRRQSGALMWLGAVSY
ncbi:hypothetical protein BDR06DRAFT_1015376 [Suillus hirtellus]|nr:hypothetical protein BDR06DRAFT_1015376 [Suillus hirtellus]